MASSFIQDRWFTTHAETGKKVRTERHGKGLQYRARFRDDEDKQHSKSFAKKAHAQIWLDEQTAALVTGQYASPSAGKITFKAFYADWSTRQVWAPGTRTAMDLAAGSVTFAEVSLRSIKRSHIEQWVQVMNSPSDKRSKPLEPSTIHTRMNNVRAVLRGATNDRLIPRDPSVGVTLPRRRRKAAAMRVPTTAEVGALLREADDDFRPFIALAAFAGLRLGEAAGVQVGDVAFLQKQLQVTRQVQRGSGGDIEIRPPKYGSERTVYLSAELVTMMSEHVASIGAAPSPSTWLFTDNSDSQPPHQNTVGYRWRQTLKRAGVEPFKLHDLRHFYASGLIAAGCDVVTVQRALGHSSATTTLNTYSHLWPTAEDRTRAASADMLRETLEAASAGRKGPREAQQESAAL